MYNAVLSVFFWACSAMWRCPSARTFVYAVLRTAREDESLLVHDVLHELSPWHLQVARADRWAQARAGFSLISAGLATLIATLKARLCRCAVVLWPWQAAGCCCP